MSAEPDAADLALQHLLAVQRRGPDDVYPPSGLGCPHWCQEPHGHPCNSLSLHATDATADAPARFHAKTLHYTEEGAVIGIIAVEALALGSARALTRAGFARRGGRVPTHAGRSTGSCPAAPERRGPRRAAAAEHPAER